MSLKDELDVDIRNFFKQIETQSTNDKLKTLRNLIDKYIHLSTTTHLIDNIDLMNIVSNAKGIYANKPMPLYLKTSSNRVSKVRQDDLSTVCLVESIVAFLNKNDCLKKMPKFNYTEDKYPEE